MSVVPLSTLKDGQVFRVADSTLLSAVNADRLVRVREKGEGFVRCISFPAGTAYNLPGRWLVRPLLFVDPPESIEGQFALAVLQGDDNAAWPALPDRLAEAGRIDQEVGRQLHQHRVALHRLAAYVQDRSPSGPARQKALVAAALAVLGDVSNLEKEPPDDKNEKGGCP